MVFSIETLLVQLVVNIVVNVIFVSPFLWIAGRLLAGKAKAKFTDALWIVVLGTVVSFFFNYFLADLISGFAVLISYVVLFVIWLALVKHFFDCGWLKALAISIVAVIVAVIILFIIFLVLTLIGIGTGWLPIGDLMNF
jgi:hypothetical protein